MATSLPSPPESRSSTPGTEQKNDTTVSTQRLDELLEEYLQLLDQYTTLRDELSKSFSSGFFSLARAQRASTLGSGRRYGQDCYDERMKAQRRVTIDEEGLGWKIGTTVPPVTNAQNEEPNTTKDEPEDQATDTDERVSEDAKEQRRRGSDEDKNTKTERNKQDPATRDPITWFGLLAPPALRQCQAQYVRAVDSQIPALLLVDSRMRHVEEEIWALREELRMMRDYEEDKAAVEEQHVSEGLNEQLKPPAKRQPHRTPRRNLPARPAHSKSHLLKLGE